MIMTNLIFNNSLYTGAHAVPESVSFDFFIFSSLSLRFNL